MSKEPKSSTAASSADSKESTASPAKETEKPTGKEHWGSGGKFRIDASGKRVRVPVKK